MPRASSEYGGCSVRNRYSPRRSATCCASTMPSAGNVDEPNARIFPARTRSVSAPRVSSTSVFGSGRWSWYRSIRSVPSRRRLFSTSVTIQRREPPLRFRVFSSSSGKKTLVASTTSSRRPFRALPTISSDSPVEYMSAVSTKLMPASSAAWMIRVQSSWSGLPTAPNIIAPRHWTLTSMPVPPSVR
jgi:hypothetical protein